MLLRRLTLPFLLLGLSGCSWFGDKDEEVIKPAALTKIRDEVSLNSLWSVRVGAGAEDKAIKLEPGVSGGRVFAASADGTVMALQASSGNKIWSQNVRDIYTSAEVNHAFAKDIDIITGGVGVGDDLVLVGTAAGEIVALFQSDGSLAWRSIVASEVLAPPQVSNQLVVAQSIDGSVTGLDAFTGERRWRFNTPPPALTLRGTSTPILRDDVVIAGFANGRVALIDPDRGIAAIDERVAAAKGRSDLERLIDIDGKMVFQNGRLFVASYQGRILAIDLNAGRPLWSEDVSTTVGLGAGFGNVYLASVSDQLTAYDMDNGRIQWSTDALSNRDVTTPVTTGSFIAVADFEGYVHLIAQSDGRFVGRRRVDSKGIYTPVLAADNRLFVMGNSGRLSVFELQ